jgi:L-fucose isomerase-like protein
MEDFNIAVVAFSHPMIYDSSPEREAFVRGETKKLGTYLEGNGFAVINPLEKHYKADNPRYGISTNAEADCYAREIIAADAEAVAISLTQWTNPHLIVSFVKQVGLPCCIYTSGGIDYPGETTAAAAYASMSESAASPRNCVMLERFREWNQKDIVPWLKGVAAVTRMKKSRILAWGGTYGANIPYTRDDESLLEDLLVREVVIESEDVITYAALEMVKKNPGRIEAFQKWLEKNGTKIGFDGKMLTKEAFNLQIAQYFAARDRLASMKDERIAAVSIKCHFETSTSCLGCTECLIPAFLPFAEDNEGKRDIIPVACEGDAKGAITEAILTMLKPGVPPLFGDLIVHTDEHITIANCGSSSVYWADPSSAAAALSKTSILPQLHGRSGGAVRYLSSSGPVTAARFFRFKGKYYMYMGLGRIHEQREFSKSTHGVNWPQTLLAFDDVDHYEIFKTIPANHMVLTSGNVIDELIWFCRYNGIRIVRCDNQASLASFKEQTAYEK